MISVKKAVKNVVNKEQKRILVISLAHDDELVVKGDNATVGNLDGNENLKEGLKQILHELPEEDDASYNFGGSALTYTESQNLEFPKMFAKLGGRNWKGGEMAKTLSRYFALLDFGKNAAKTYGKAEDKPVWWPRRPKWRKFRSPSKVSKEVCTLLIRLLLEHFGIDANTYYVNYPDEEGGNASSSDSSGEEEDYVNDDDEDDEDDEDDSDDSDHASIEIDENDGNQDLAKRVNAISDRSREGNQHLLRRAQNIRQLEEGFRNHEEEENRRQLEEENRRQLEEENRKQLEEDNIRQLQEREKNKKRKKNYVLLEKTTRSKSKKKDG